MSDTMLELALRYARQGFTVLPANPVNKAALTKNWTNKPDKGEPGSSKARDCPGLTGPNLGRGR